MPRRCCCQGETILCETAAVIDADCEGMHPGNCYNIAFCIEGETGDCAVVNTAPLGIAMTRTGELTFEYIEAGVRKYDLTYAGGVVDNFTFNAYRWDGSSWVLCRSLASGMNSANPYALNFITATIKYRFWLRGSPANSSLTITTAGIAACTTCLYDDINPATDPAIKVTGVTGLNGTVNLPQGFPLLDFGYGKCQWQAQNGTVSIDIWTDPTDCALGNPPDAQATIDLIWTFYWIRWFSIQTAPTTLPILGAGWQFSLCQVDFFGVGGTYPGRPCAGQTLGPVANSNACPPDELGQFFLAGGGTATLIVPGHQA